MKQFNLEEYLKNPLRKVITRDGRNVKIHCTNYYANQTIIAEIEGLGVSYAFDIDGTFSYGNSPNDLFFAPEKHEGWINIFRNFGGNNYLGDCSVIKSKVYKSKESAEKEGNKCLGYITTIKIEWEE